MLLAFLLPAHADDAGAACTVKVDPDACRSGRIIDLSVSGVSDAATLSWSSEPAGTFEDATAAATRFLCPTVDCAADVEVYVVVNTTDGQQWCFRHIPVDCDTGDADATSKEDGCACGTGRAGDAVPFGGVLAVGLLGAGRRSRRRPRAGSDNPRAGE
jgi:MYXO-CTERM domain-containing protein